MIDQAIFIAFLIFVFGIVCVSFMYVFKGVVNDPNSFYFAIVIGGFGGISANYFSYIIPSIWSILLFGLLAIMTARIIYRFYNYNAAILTSLYITSGFLAYIIPLVPPLSEAYVEEWIQLAGTMSSIAFLVLAPLGRFRGTIGSILSILTMLGFRQFSPFSLLAIGFFPAILVRVSIQVFNINIPLLDEFTALILVFGALSLSSLLNNYDGFTKSHKGLLNNRESHEVSSLPDEDYVDRVIYFDFERDGIFWEPLEIPQSISRRYIKELTQWISELAVQDLELDGYPNASVIHSWSKISGNQNYVIECDNFNTLVIGVQLTLDGNMFTTSELLELIDGISEEYESEYTSSGHKFFVTNESLSTEAMNEIINKGFVIIESPRQVIQNS